MKDRGDAQQRGEHDGSPCTCERRGVVSRKHKRKRKKDEPEKKKEKEAAASSVECGVWDDASQNEMRGDIALCHAPEPRGEGVYPRARQGRGNVRE